MAERLKENQFDETGVNPFNAPIPGESLTASPETPRAWERPPEYTDQDEAMRAVYLEMTKFDTLKELINIIDDGVPLDEIAQVVLYKGYTEGKFTPDMMLMLAEPTIYLLIAIADYADIKDYVLYDGDDEDPDVEIPEDNITPVNMDEEEVEEVKTKIAEPTEEVMGQGLLSRMKKELPSKVKEATKDKTKEEEV
jgi:hypothetical protein